MGRLFEDYEAAELEYYRRTGIFPIMHTVVVRKQLADEHPEVVKAVYQGLLCRQGRHHGAVRAGHDLQ